MNNHLSDKHFLVGESLTIADVCLAGLFSLFVQTVLGAGERKAFTHVVNWFERCISLPSFIRRLGYIKMTEKAFKPFDKNAKVEPVKAAPKKVEEVDEDDLFGSDNEDDAEAAKKAAQAVKDASKKKVKKPVIAMSLVMLEVKPVDDTTNLDDLAAHLFKNIK